MRSLKLPRNISSIAEYRPYGRLKKIMLAVLCIILLFPGLLMITAGLLTKGFTAVLCIAGTVFAGPGILVLYRICRDKTLTAAKQRDERAGRGLEEQAGREEEHERKRRDAESKKAARDEYERIIQKEKTERGKDISYTKNDLLADFFNFISNSSLPNTSSVFNLDNIPLMIVYKSTGYRSGNEEISERTVKITDFWQAYDNGLFYFKGADSLHNEERTFRTDRILKAFDNDLEVNAESWFIEQCKKTAQYKDFSVRRLIYDTLSANSFIIILVYIARVKGMFTRNNKIIISEYVYNELKLFENTGIALENIAEEIKEIKPSLADFNAALNAIRPDEKFMDAAKQIAGKDSERIMLYNKIQEKVSPDEYNQNTEKADITVSMEQQKINCHAVNSILIESENTAVKKEQKEIDTSQSLYLDAVMRYENSEGETKTHKIEITSIYAGKSRGMYYITGEGGYGDTITFNVNNIKRLKIDDENIDSPAKYFEDAFFSVNSLDMCKDQLKTLLFIARFDGSLTGKERGHIAEYMRKYVKNRDIGVLEALTRPIDCDEKEFSAILSKTKEWTADDKTLVMETAEKLIGSKKNKDEKISALYNTVKKALEEE